MAVTECPNILFLIVLGLLAIVSIGIGTASVVIYQREPVVISNSTTDKNELKCLQQAPTFLFAVGLAGIIIGGLSIIFGILFAIFADDRPESAFAFLIPSFIYLLYFMFALIYAGILTFPCANYATQYHTVWLMCCIIFSICMGVIGISFLTCIGLMCNASFNSYDD